MPDFVAAPPLDLVGMRQPDQIAPILRRMRRQFASAEEWEAQARRDAVDDMQFRAGQQWTPQEERRRLGAGRPCLTVNTLPQYERQITNELRLNQPAINVLPVGNGADQRTAKTLKGLIRHVEQASNAKYVRQLAFESAVRIGWGYYRLVLEYDDPMSFNQEPRLAAIRNPFQVYLDPASQHPTGCDAQWGFLFEHCDREAFQEEWGFSTQQMGLWTSQGDNWIHPDHVRLAEYFWQDHQRATLVQLADGSTQLLEPLLLADVPMLPNPYPLQRFVEFLCTPRPRYLPLLPWMRQQVQTAAQWLDGLPPAFVAEYSALVGDLIGQIRQARPTELTTVRWVKTNGYVILEESIWPGSKIPLLRVVGEELDLNNKLQRSGIIRYAKDPMRMENYWITMQAEHIALSPVPPWLVAQGQVENYQTEWATANRTPRAFLPYDPVSVDGHLVPAPIRNAFEPPIQAITIALTMTQQYSQNTMGMYQTNVGAPNQKERSGRAILERDRQSDTGSYHFVDNLGLAMHSEGQQLIELLPKVMTPGKVQRIVGEDGAPGMIQVINTAQGMHAPAQLPAGIQGIYDVGVGTYDVRVEVGPSYATQRQEASSQMLELTKAMPEAMGHVLYKVVGTMDWEGASELAELLKQLPGQILDEPGSDPAAQVAQLKQQLPQLLQQLQAMNAYAKQAEAKIQELEDENKRLQAGHDLKLAELEQEAKEAEQKYTIERQKVAIEQAKAQHDMTQDSQDVSGQLRTMQRMLERLMQMEQAEQAREGAEPAGVEAE